MLASLTCLSFFLFSHVFIDVLPAPRPYMVIDMAVRSSGQRAEKREKECRQGKLASIFAYPTVTMQLGN